jgi:hypothetical protein
MEYLDWNDKLTRHFFREENSGRQIYLYFTQEVLEEAILGATLEDFRKVLLLGPPWAHKDGICSKAWEAYHGWKDRDNSSPPYLAYLCLFALAADLEADLPTHSYYPRLNKALGVESSSRPPGFEGMAYLWMDLEEWSVRIKQGALGVFKAIQYGKHQHIGYPLFQSLMSASERKGLASFFQDEGMDPENPPAENETLRLLQKRTDFLRPKTIKLLNGGSSQDPGRRTAFLKVVLEELSEWDGGAPEPFLNSGGSEDKPDPALIVLSCAIDETERKASIWARCRSVKGLPDEGWLQEEAGQPEFYFSEDAEGWSSPLEKDGMPWDASRLVADSKGIAFKSRGLRAKWKPKQCYLLQDGLEAGLGALIECNRIQDRKQYLILVPARHEKSICDWGTQHCKSFSKIGINKGLPIGWGVFRFTGALKSHPNAEHFPMLCLPSTASIRLKNGISVRGGRKYFDFCPPEIHFEGMEEGTKIKINGRVVEYSGPMMSHQEISRICDMAPIGSFKVSIERETFVLDSISYSVESASSFEPTLAEVGVFGEERHAGSLDESDWRGALCLVQKNSRTPFHLFLDDMNGQVSLIGPVIGQIFRGRVAMAPLEWDPVWLITSGRRPVLHYVGIDTDAEAPRDADNATASSVDLWAREIWHNRKKIRAPVGRSASSLWRAYMKAASVAVG